MPLSFTPLLCLKRCYACDQWHSSRASTPLTGRLCNCVQTLKAEENKVDLGVLSGKSYSFMSSAMTEGFFDAADLDGDGAVLFPV
jgi:hypothetical protein